MSNEGQNETNKTLEGKVYWGKYRLLLIGILGLTTLYSFAYLGLNSNWVKTRIQRVLTNSLSGRFQIRQLVVEPTLTDFEIRGVTIKESTGADVIEADRVQGSVDIYGLMTGRLVLNQSHVWGANVNLDIESDGGVNIAKVFGSPVSPKASEEAATEPAVRQKASDPLEIVLTNIEVHDTDFEMETGQFDFRVRDIDIPNAYLSVAGGNLVISLERLKGSGGDFRFYSELFDRNPDRSDWTFDISDVDIRDWRWRNEGFNVDNVDVLADGVGVEAMGGMRFPSGEDVAPGRHFQYQGDVDISIPYWTPVGEYFLSDVLRTQVPRLEATVDGDLNEIEASVETDIDRLRVSNWMFEDLDISGKLRNQWVRVTSGKGQIFDGDFSLDGGGFNLITQHFWGDLSLEDPKAGGLFEVLELGALPWLNGEMSGGIELFGRLPDYSYEFYPGTPLNLVTWLDQTNLDLWFTEKTRLTRENTGMIPGTYVDVAKGSRLELTPDAFKVPEAKLQSGRDRLELKKLRWSMVPASEAGIDNRTSLELNIADLGVWFGQGKGRVRGGVDISADLYGDFQYPSGVISISEGSNKLRLPGLKSPVESMALQVQLQQGVLDFQTFDIATAIGHLNASGHLDLAPDPVVESLERKTLWYSWSRFKHPIELNLQASGVDVSYFGDLLGVEGFDGAFDLQLAAEGYLQEPKASFTGSMDTFGYRDLPLGVVDLRGELEKGRLTIGSARLSGNKVNLEGRGYLENNGNFSFISSGQRIQLGALGELVTGLPAIDGTGEFRIHGFGSLAKPYVGGDLMISDLNVAKRDLGNVVFAATTREGEVHLEGSLPPDIGIQLNWPIYGDKSIRGAIRLEAFRVLSLFPEAKQFSRGVVEGEVGFDMASDFSDWSVTGDFSNIRGVFNNQAIQNENPLQFTYTKRRGVAIEPTTFEMANRTFRVGGNLEPVSGAVDIQTSGRLNLAVLNGLKQQFPEYFPSLFIESQGWVELDVALRGNRDKVRPMGDIRFNGAEFSLRTFREPIEFETGEVSFNEDQIVIRKSEPVQGRFLGGVARIHGQVQRTDTGYGRAQISFWSHNNTFRVSEAASVTFDSRLQLAAQKLLSFETWNLSGRVNIVDALVYRNFSLFEKQVTGRVIGAFSRTADRYQGRLLDNLPALGDLELDVSVVASDSIYIQTQIDRLGFDIELQTDLQVAGRLANLNLNGNVNVVDGKLTFQGEEFEVRTGTLRFSGEPTNPWIDIVAGADIRSRCQENAQQGQDFRTNLDFAGSRNEDDQQQYHITMHLQGETDNLNIELDSTPYADRRDILSLLLTGCTVDQLDTSSAGGPTLEIALAPLLGQLEREIQDAVKVSEFSIMPGVDRTQVRIGDELTRRLSWNFRLDAGVASARGGQEARLEYKLSDRWAVELSERGQQFREQRESAPNRYLLDLQLKYRLPVD